LELAATLKGIRKLAPLERDNRVSSSRGCPQFHPKAIQVMGEIGIDISKNFVVPQTLKLREIAKEVGRV
jgi:hypothetical protein